MPIGGPNEVAAAPGGRQGIRDVPAELADVIDPSPARRPPAPATAPTPEATWGHRKGGGPGQHSDLFFGYFLNAATMIGEEQGPAVPELARRMAVTSCHLDPSRIRACPQPASRPPHSGHSS